MEAVLLAHSQIKDVRALLVLESKFPASRLPLKTFLVLKSLTLSPANNPRYTMTAYRMTSAFKMELENSANLRGIYDYTAIKLRR